MIKPWLIILIATSVPIVTVLIWSVLAINICQSNPTSAEMSWSFCELTYGRPLVMIRIAYGLAVLSSFFIPGYLVFKNFPADQDGWAIRRIALVTGLTAFPLFYFIALDTDKKPDFFAILYGGSCVIWMSCSAILMCRSYRWLAGRHKERKSVRL